MKGNRTSNSLEQKVDTLSLKVNLDDGTFASIEINSTFDADMLIQELCSSKMIREHSMQEYKIYVSTKSSKKDMLRNNIMRLLSPEENVIEVIKEYVSYKIPYKFHMLPEVLYKSKEEKRINEFNEKFFKSKKWQRVGNLFIGTKESLEPNADKKKAFTKKIFYLGNDNLYYTSENSNFKLTLRNT